MHSEAYREFMKLWDTIADNLVETPEKHRKFFFDFLFLFILSVRGNLKEEEIGDAKMIASKFYAISLSDLDSHIELSLKTLPEFQLNDSGAFTSMSGDVFSHSMMVVLLKETALDYEVTNSYTFDEAISFLPEELNYPPELAVQILTGLDYPSGN